MIANKEELIQRAYDLGFKAEKDFGGCGQCTMIGVFDALGIDNPGLVKAGSGLASGMGKMCDGVCGGYAGGSMAMASIFGRRREFMDNDADEKTTSYEMTCSLRESFLKNYSTVICKDIHQRLFNRTYDMYSPDERQKFLDDGAHIDKCTGVVGRSAAETVRIILEEADKRGMTLEDIRKKAM
jgi:hypothetical protein